MIGRSFVDTNILLYARDASEPQKQKIAATLMEELWENRCGRLSVQVLNEYFVNVTKKLRPGLPIEEAWEEISDLMLWRPVKLDETLMKEGYSIHTRYGLSWWDSLIVAAASVSGCKCILTEDLSPGQSYSGVEVINPF